MGSPMNISFKLIADSGIDTREHEKCHNIVGILLYLATKMRKDIAAAANMLSKYVADPKHNHMIAAKRGLGYFVGHTKKV